MALENQTIIYRPIDKESFAQKGEAIFHVIEEKLKPQHTGEFLAIDIESSDYFLGRTGSEAVQKAKKKYPDKIFYLARIGSRAAVSFRSRLAR